MSDLVYAALWFGASFMGCMAGYWLERRFARPSLSAPPPLPYDAGVCGAASRFRVNRITRQPGGDALLMLTREDDRHWVGENGLWIWVNARDADDLRLDTRYVLRREDEGGRP